MPDSQETRVLKDINRHLKNIDESSGGDAPDISSMNKNTEMVMGNFSSLIDARLKQIVLQNDRMFNATFGELQGFSVEQNAAVISELGEVIRELEMGNAHAEALQHNEFLKEKERQTDLNINRRTNALLEDILEQDEKTAGKEKESGGGAGIKGFLGGLLGGKGLSGVLGGIGALGKKVAKKLFLPALAIGAGIEFLKGWTEAGDDASVRDKFNSGISRTLSDLTFGLVPKKFFDDILNSLEDGIVAAWNRFKVHWDAFVGGDIGGKDFLARIVSDLSFGALTPEQVKKASVEISDAMVEVIENVWDALLDGIFGDFREKITNLFKAMTDPVSFAKEMINQMMDDLETERDVKEIDKKVQEFVDAGMSLPEAMKKAVEEFEVLGDEKNWYGARKELDPSSPEAIKRRSELLNKIIKARQEESKELIDVVPLKPAKTKQDKVRDAELDRIRRQAEIDAQRQQQPAEGGTLNQVIDNSQTYTAPPASFTETDDINLRMFGPRTSMAPFTR